jgi:hypothetical protein
MNRPADPFAVLGLDRRATLVDAGAARRRLAREHHPDRGGDAQRMREVNEAYRQVVQALRRAAEAAPEPAAPTAPEPPPPGEPPAARHRRRGFRVEHDWPSFTIDALPAEAFEALLVVTSWIGELVADDPPYLLEALLQEPEPCWCRLELLPEAGGSIVNLTVASLDEQPAPEAEAVRDVWMAALNDLHRSEA